MIDVAELKQRVSLKDAFEFLGLEWPTTSKRFPQVLCPLPDHDEKTPSFTLYVRPETDHEHWYCFGCSSGGDVIELVQLVKGWDFIEAVNQLAEWVGLGLVQNAWKEPEPNPRALFSLVSDQAHYDVAAWLKHYGVTIDMADLVFREYDEIMRQYDAAEADTESLVKQLLAWRQKWKHRLA